ncbi:MAG: Fe-S cluster assembly protein SufD [Saprospiraceae bacterium]|nr:Fe-S cluster assembly protein SufD [Saprospiraceae bacterium]
MSIISKDRDANTQAWLEVIFKAYEERLNGLSNHPLAAFKKEAFTKLQSSRFPTRRDEDWKYTNVGPILKNSYQQGQSSEINSEELDDFLFEGLDVVKIVFINGVLNESLSTLHDIPEGATITTLKEALEDDAKTSTINALIQQKSGTAVNTFLPMNLAFAKHGFLIETTANSKVEKPFHFIYINTLGNESHFAHPQLFIKSNTSSELTVIESHHGTDPEAEYFTNVANYIYVGKNSNVDHYKLQYEGKSAFQINNTIVTQERDSEYSHYGIDLGGKIVRNNLSTELLNSGTQTNYYGVYLGLDKQHIDNQTFIDHAVPHCESNELYKGILSDKSRGVFNGKVLVRQDAQKTNAFQQNSSLVLSNNAVMDAKPQLEIYADDVKCSHGATIGQLDENSIFYLKSRGLNDHDARNLLQKAFVGEVVGNFKIPQIRESVLAKIDNKLSRV